MLTIAEAKEVWLSADLSACQLLADDLGPERIVHLGLHCLRSVPSTLTCAAPIAELIQLGNTRADWHKAHASFDLLRSASLSLRSSRTTDQLLRLHTLIVAENTARVMYNLTDPPDPFDADSSGWLLVTMSEFCRALAVPTVTRTVWGAIEAAVGACSSQATF